MSRHTNWSSHLRLASGLVSVAAGSLAIVLLSESHKVEGDLIVIVCATLIFGLNSLLIFTRDVNWVNIKYSMQINNISVNDVIVPFIFQVITVCCNVYLFHRVNTTHFMTSVSQKEKHILTALQSLLILSFFISGITLGVSSTNPCTVKLGDNSANINPMYEEKFVPVKNSAQTLTPSMDFENKLTTLQKNPTENIPEIGQTIINKPVHPVGVSDIQARYNSSHISQGSVVVHPLVNTAYINTTSESPNTKRRRQRLLSKFKRLNRKFKSKNFGTSDNQNQNIDTSPTLEQNIINKRGTIFSELSGFSKGLLPFGGSVIEKESKPDNTSHSLILDVAQQRNQPLELLNSPQLEDERNAIGRFDNLLLPPYLRANEELPYTPELHNQFENASPLLPPPIENNILKTRSVGSDNILDNFDLHTIPQAHEHEFESDEFPTSNHINYPSHISLEMWEKNKDSFINGKDSRPANLLLPVFTLDNTAKTPEFNLKKLETLQENENTLPLAGLGIQTKENKNSLPLAGLGIQTSSSFSFPLKEPFGSYSKSEIGEEYSIINSEDQPSSVPLSLSDEPSFPKDINVDAISALDEYLHDEENNESIDDHAMEESLNQNFSSSFIMDTNTAYDAATRHSPTKSVISVLSGSGSLGHKKSHSRLTNFLGHSRGNSLINQYNTGNNSAQSSPTKSVRRQKLSQKLSFSNISDTFNPIPINEAKTFGVKYSNSFSHKVNKSIDFSYIRTLQGNDHNSPSKTSISRSSTLKDNNDPDLRRHSVATDIRLDAPVLLKKSSKSSFYMQTANKASEEIHVIPNTIETEIREVSGISVDSAKTSSSEKYPDIVMSEYDREKWNALKNIQQIPQDSA